MDRHLNIGAMIYPRMDQIDFTGPFEVLAQLPNSTFHVAWKEKQPVRDYRGLILTPERTLAEVPPLDVLVIPGGPGQENLMEDKLVLAFIRDQAARAHCVFSVCTGALICGAAGLLKGVRATTHWGAFDLLAYFGAIPVNQRVVVDGKLVTAAGVTAGIDGALRVAALLRGDQVAQEIQLGIEYAPEPPFQSGTPATAPAAVRKAVEARIAGLTKDRLSTARRVASRLGIPVKAESGSPQ
ncbi:DJ-1/PfpI family protein [Singulisphaera sp. GP187]|uniref:DJ-1/PfpI family protein n=1 Tax=Singulisphaera sp. GP187 TaxID=1882752 RepID=UPI001C1F958E|nr:DJ-1/PfpI family protein [Singulisphaera sp. GP187]